MCVNNNDAKQLRKSFKLACVYIHICILVYSCFILRGSNSTVFWRGYPTQPAEGGRPHRPRWDYNVGEPGVGYPHYTMVLRIHSSEIILVLFCVTSWVAVETSKPDLSQIAMRNSRLTECRYNCTNVRKRLVCGSDKRTYTSRCALNRAKHCEGRRVSFASKGKCSAPRCKEERKQAQEEYKDEQTTVYIPVCKSDGTYAEVQCHAATKYCWCVTPDGRPIPNTSQRGKKPSCNSRNNNNKKRSHGRRKAKRGCDPRARKEFNKALIELFKQDYARVPKPTQRTSPANSKGLPLKPAEKESLLDTLEKRVTEWKFSELDKDKDNHLKKKEIRHLRRMVKKLVKPKSCARNFAKVCDMDKDNKIARKEWSVCLGVEINRIGPNHPIFTAPPLYRRQPGIQKTVNVLQTRTQEKEREPPPPKNCGEDRSAALEQHRADPNGRIFIPVCTEAGKYKKEQCHKSTGYCWCVDEKSGKPIRGTSTHKQTPDCTNVKPDRELKDCPFINKKRFLTDLMDKMTKKMADLASNNTDKSTRIEPNPEHSLEERVLSWQLRIFDKNKNLSLEKGEVRLLRKEIRKYSSRKKSSRKCARHFIEYCDEDRNKKLTIAEWINCMGINDKQKSIPINPKRKGPNPFKKYLKGEGRK